jgi:hypothetical protein
LNWAQAASLRQQGDVRKEIANLQREKRKRLANRNKTGTGCSNVNKIIFN